MITELLLMLGAASLYQIYRLNSLSDQLTQLNILNEKKLSLLIENAKQEIFLYLEKNRKEIPDKSQLDDQIKLIKQLFTELSTLKKEVISSIFSETNPLSDLLVLASPTNLKIVLATWPFLNSETKVRYLKELTSLKDYALPFEFIELILSSPNPYERYLIRRKLTLRSNEQEEQKRIHEILNNEPEGFVKFSSEEGSCFSINKPEDLLNFPKEKLFAILRSEGPLHGETFSAAINLGLQKALFSDDFLLQMINEYVLNPNLKKSLEIKHFNACDYDQCKDFESLWGLVLNLPEKPAHILSYHLPVASGHNNEIPDEILSKMDKRILGHLLYRPELKKEDFRRELFFSPIGTFPNFCLDGALSCNFRLLYKDLIFIFQERRDLLKHFNFSDINPVFIEAIEDFSKTFPFGEGNFLDFDFVVNSMENTYKDSDSARRDLISLECKIYEFTKCFTNYTFHKDSLHNKGDDLTKLVKIIVENKYSELISKYSDIFKPIVVENDPWASFVNFVSVIAKSPQFLSDLQKVEINKPWIK